MDFCCSDLIDITIQVHVHDIVKVHGVQTLNSCIDEKLKKVTQGCHLVLAHVIYLGLYL